MLQKSILLPAIIIFLSQSIVAQNTETKTVTIDKAKMAYRLFRPDSGRKANEPIVVFES